EHRLLKREMVVALGPGRHRQLPAERQMLSHRTDPSVDTRIANRFRCSIEPELLRGLVAMVEIELIDELVERHGEIGWASAGDLCDFSQGLRACHGSPAGLLNGAGKLT